MDQSYGDDKYKEKKDWLVNKRTRPKAISFSPNILPSVFRLAFEPRYFTLLLLYLYIETYIIYNRQTIAPLWVAKIYSIVQSSGSSFYVYESIVQESTHFSRAPQTICISVLLIYSSSFTFPLPLYSRKSIARYEHSGFGYSIKSYERLYWVKKKKNGRNIHLSRQRLLVIHSFVKHFYQGKNLMLGYAELKNALRHSFFYYFLQLTLITNLESVFFSKNDTFRFFLQTKFFPFVKYNRYSAVVWKKNLLFCYF